MLQEMIEGSSTVAIDFHPEQFRFMLTDRIQEVVTSRIISLGCVADKLTEDFYRKRSEFSDERKASRKLSQELDIKTPPKTYYSELNQFKDDCCKFSLDLKTDYSMLDQLRGYCCEALAKQINAIKSLSDDCSTIKECLADSMAKYEEPERIIIYKKGIQNYNHSITQHKKRMYDLSLCLVGVGDYLKDVEDCLDRVSQRTEYIAKTLLNLKSLKKEG